MSITHTQKLDTIQKNKGLIHKAVRSVTLTAPQYLTNEVREDLYNEGYMTFYKLLGRYDGKVTLSTYIYRNLLLALKRVFGQIKTVMPAPQIAIERAQQVMKSGDESNCSEYIKRVIEHLDNGCVQYDHDIFENMAADHSVDIDNIVDRRLNREFINQIMSCLTEKQKQLVELLYLAEDPMSITDIGIRLGITRRNVQKLKDRALQNLRAECIRLNVKRDML